jgi:hypothetical protein
MNKFCFVVAISVGAWALVPSIGTAEKETKFGDTAFLAYEGPQDWPTAESAQVIKDYAVPIYIGLPPKKYTVLGRIYDPRTSGVGVVGRAFAEGLFSEKDRKRDCARQAQFRSGDAVLVTNDEKLIKAFNLSKEDLEKTTPLFEHKDKITVAIKFQ